MKYYEIVRVNGETLEEWTEWSGSDYGEALKAKAETLFDFENHLTKREKAVNSIECRAYDIPDETQENDGEAFFDVVCEAKCNGYSVF